MFTTRRRLTAEPVEHRWHTAAWRTSHRPLIIREPEAGWQATRATVTVAAVRAGDTCHPERVMARLTGLADGDALLVVFGFDGRAACQAVVTGLRQCLPQREVVAVPVRHHHEQLLRDAAVVEDLLDAGRVPVALTPVAALLDVTAEIASYLRADRVLRVLRDDFFPVWRRAGASVR